MQGHVEGTFLLFTYKDRDSTTFVMIVGMILHCAEEALSTDLLVRILPSSTLRKTCVVGGGRFEVCYVITYETKNVQQEHRCRFMSLDLSFETRAFTGIHSHQPATKASSTFHPSRPRNEAFLTTPMVSYRRRRNQCYISLGPSILRFLSRIATVLCVGWCLGFGISDDRRYPMVAAFHAPQRPAATFRQARNSNRSSIRKDSLGRMSSLTLYFMNWFGFGSSNSESDSELQQPQDLSTLLTILPKDNNKNNSPKGDVVTIMDSMDQLKRAQRVGKITASLVQELKSITVEGSSENGKVKVTLDGQQNPISTYVDENYYREKVDVNEFTNALTTAMKDAQMKSMEKMNEKMKNVYNELGFYIQQ
jgi:nucleoid-associated protein EbfC